MPALHQRKRVNLALQGGGAHGAFTWGALDRLLEEERLEIDGISGTSAGAMNASMLKMGWIEGGHAGARARLDSFWGEIRRRSHFQSSPVAQLAALFRRDAPWLASAIMQSPMHLAQQAVTRAFSPYEWNPLNLNPLRELLLELTDWEEVCRDCPPYLFVCATNVRTGKIRVFRGAEIGIDAILASAALPQLFQAVRVGEEDYWDGGFMGNPPLYPLFYHTRTPDVIIVHVNPIVRPYVPTTAAEIENRVNEISFNSSLLRELRAVAFVKRLIAEGRLNPGDMMNVLIHSIRDDETMGALDAGSKLTPEPQLFDALKTQGRRVADAFLRAHWRDIGSRSTVDLQAMVD